MKKSIIAILALTLAFGLIFASCTKDGSNNSTTAVPASATDKTITVGASPTPHAEILEQVKATLAAQGYTLNIVKYEDYVLPNKALADKDIDANYFQHAPYLNNFNTENNKDLLALASIHYEPFGIYGNDVTDLKNLKQGATIFIPADSSNETRALFLLQQEGLIKLPDNADAAKGVTVLDIADKKGYNIVAIQADGVAAQLKNSDKGTIAVINGNYALAAGLKIADALASEDANGAAAQTYANIIAVRKEDKDSPKIQALVAALKTDAVKTYIQNTYNGAVVAIF